MNCRPYSPILEIEGQWISVIHALCSQHNENCVNSHNTKYNIFKNKYFTVEIEHYNKPLYKNEYFTIQVEHCKNSLTKTNILLLK